MTKRIRLEFALTLIALQLAALTAVRLSVINPDNDIWIVLPLMVLGWTGLVVALVLMRLGSIRAFQIVAVVSFLMLSCQAFYFTSLRIVGQPRPALQRQ